MSYEKLGFVSGQTLKAEHLNHMEEGIAKISWDDLKDKPFGEETTVVDVLPETSITASELYEVFINCILTVGDICTVTWNGIEYTCVVDTFEGFPVFGNIGLVMGGEGTGEPFVVLAQGQILQIVSLDGTSEQIVSIKVELKTVNKLDKKYLPESVTNKFRTTNGDTLTWDGYRGGYLSTKVFEDYFYKVSSVVPTKSDIEKGVSITDNRNVTDNEVHEESGYFWINGCYIALEDNVPVYDKYGEQVGILYEKGIWFGFFPNSSGDDYPVALTISNYTGFATEKLSEAYFPESVDSIVIRSSSKYSDKKFRITVDDSGTISATEVD